MSDSTNMFVDFYINKVEPMFREVRVGFDTLWLKETIVHTYQDVATFMTGNYMAFIALALFGVLLWALVTRAAFRSDMVTARLERDRFRKWYYEMKKSRDNWQENWSDQVDATGRLEEDIRTLNANIDELAESLRMKQEVIEEMIEEHQNALDELREEYDDRISDMEAEHENAMDEKDGEMIEMETRLNAYTMLDNLQRAA